MKWVAGNLYTRLEAPELANVGVLELDEKEIEAGFVGVLGAFEVYRGSVRGHRMVNLRLILRRRPRAPKPRRGGPRMRSGGTRLSVWFKKKAIGVTGGLAPRAERGWSGSARRTYSCYPPLEPCSPFYPFAPNALRKSARLLGTAVFGSSLPSNSSER